MSEFRMDRERWRRLSFYEQMGNVASEVGRAIAAQRSGRLERVPGAISRALDLLDASIEQLTDERSHRLREVLRARDEFCRLFYDGTFDEDADNIERYFMQFALVARKQELDSR
ncbi:MAG: hypothetical protein LBH64_02505 [Coriobacteriales bacterium]|jgi:hypothetical protein|nr:hypothetical protein [Coriobacteriales bacterium]